MLYLSVWLKKGGDMIEDKRILIIDGNSLINRAYYAMANLRNSKGVYTGGVHGFSMMLFNLQEEFSPTHMCVAFDMRGPTIRHKAYKDYKGTRKGMPEELAMQMPIMKEILEAISIPYVELEGYEADDLIGTIALYFKERGVDTHVITGDKDALQLVANEINVHITQKGISQLKKYEEEDILEELGVRADQVIDFKGLSGDSSDNIPGIPGFGPKTASKLLNEFGTVEAIIEKGDQIANKRWRGLVETYAEQAVLSKKLATIELHVPVELKEEMFLLKEADVEKSLSLFQKYELKSLEQKLVKASESEKKPNQNDDDFSYHICSASELKALFNQVDQVNFKLFYERDEGAEKKLLEACFALEDEVYFLDSPESILELKSFFEDESLVKHSFDLKKDIVFLNEMGIVLRGYQGDGLVGSYLLDPTRKEYAISDLSREYLDVFLESEESFLGKGVKKKKLSQVESDSRKNYIGLQLRTLNQLNESIFQKLKDHGMMDLYDNIEKPLIEILAKVEAVGFKIDLSALEDLDERLKEQLEKNEKNIYAFSQEEFNINSPKQLGQILFEKMGLPPLKKTKTGYSTSHDVLEKLASKHDIVAEILEYRTYSKLKSTYVDGLREVINKKTGRIQTSLNQTVTATGRLSSTEPNLQNIPVRLPFGRKVRKCFVADEDCVLMAADYSQIELRILAHLSNDPMLIEAFNKDRDIHQLTASQVFGIAESEVSSLQRSRAKEVNFGIIYGMGEFTLSENLKISRDEAKSYIESYFKSYPSVKGFMEKTVSDCKEKGYVETLFGRKRYIQDIDHKNFMLRSAAERIARNTPLQGTAADIIKMAMIKVEEALQAGAYRSKLVLQVHDELILNVPHEEVEPVRELLKTCMEEACQLNVHLKVDVNQGESWYDLK